MSQLTDLTLNGGSTKDKNIKFDLDILQKINEWKDEVDNLHTSKFIGEVMSEILQNDEIAKMERSVEKQLAQELGSVPVCVKKSYLSESVQEVVYADSYIILDEFNNLVTQAENSDEFDALRNTYTVRVEDVTQLNEEVSIRQHSYVLNKVAKRLLHMPFNSRLHRLRSKEQLLKTVRGYEIEEPTEWVSNISQKDEGVFAEVFDEEIETNEIPIDENGVLILEEMGPEHFDQIEFDPDGYDTNRIKNGETKIHAVRSAARNFNFKTEQQIYNMVGSMFDVSQPTQKKYAKEVFEMIVAESMPDGAESEMGNFVGKVENEVRKRTTLIDSQEHEYQSATEILNIFDRDRPENPSRIVAETVKLLHALDNLYKEYPNSSASKKKRKQLRKDIAQHAAHHFQYTDDVKENVLHDLIEKTWFFEYGLKKYEAVLNADERNIEEFLVELEQGREDKSKQAEKEAEDAMEKYNKSEFV